MELWMDIIRNTGSTQILEIGVYRGEFAAGLLATCNEIRKYYLLDPWRNLLDWNKPANKDDASFNAFLEETRERTEFAADKRVILRGKTTEVIDQLEDGSLDLVYIDGDHTLKGISIDLLSAWKKVRPGGWIGGDDFTPSIWQHSTKYEPSMIFPYAVYFAEAIHSPIYALPYDQFIIHRSGEGFQFVDTTGKYPNTSVREHFSWGQHIKLGAKRLLSMLHIGSKTY
jgi:hypothetical protein